MLMDPPVVRDGGPLNRSQKWFSGNVRKMLVLLKTFALHYRLTLPTSLLHSSRQCLSQTTHSIGLLVHHTKKLKFERNEVTNPSWESQYSINYLRGYIGRTREDSFL